MAAEPTRTFATNLPFRSIRPCRRAGPAVRLGLDVSRPDNVARRAPAFIGPFLPAQSGRDLPFRRLSNRRRKSRSSGRRWPLSAALNESRERFRLVDARSMTGRKRLNDAKAP
jgi:hypothetical protein